MAQQHRKRGRERRPAPGKTRPGARAGLPRVESNGQLKPEERLGNGKVKEQAVAGRGRQVKPEILTTIPPHLAGSSWINFEVAAALAVHSNLIEDVSRLKDKQSAPRVHRARVSLRRWFSIWSVLVDDGWETKSFRKEITKPLRKLLKMLGTLRDIDVNIELGQKMSAPEHLCADWAKDRKHEQKQLSRYMSSFKVKKLAGVEDFLLKRAEKVERQVNAVSAEEPTAFKHLGNHVVEHEKAVRKLVKTARSSEELHELRLAIKKWRYMLTEFFGLTNLELVRAQQLLGQLHDCDRLTLLLREDELARDALAKLESRRKDLLREFAGMRANFPYGLRPSITSLVPAALPEASSGREFHEIST